jgi:fatty acid desaturase
MSENFSPSGGGARPVSWYRVPLAKERLRELTQRSNWKGFLQVIPYLALLVATGALAFYAYAHLPLPWLFVILFFHGTFYAFLLNGFHELVHGTLFRTKALNSVFLRVFSFLSWNNHVLFRASHIRHHASTLHPPDDEEVVLPLHLTIRTFLLCAVVNPLGFFKVVRATTRHSVGLLNTPWEHTLFPERDRVGRRLLGRWARIVLIGHLIVVAASVASGHWLFAVVTTFARFYGGGFQWLCNITQHIGLQDNVSDFRLCCRTIELNPFARFLYFRMNYHTEHHMYAAVPCYNLGKLHRTIAHAMPATARGLIAAWREILEIFRLQAKDPSYKRVYQLPSSAAT